MKIWIPICLAILLTMISSLASASVVYQRVNLVTTNFVPFGSDGVPGKPSPGDHLGNQITLAGTARFLTRATVYFGAGSSLGLTNTTHDTYTVALFQNDGPSSSPGTKIASSSVAADTLGPPITVIFPFSTPVPDTFTVVVSSGHPLNTYSTLTGIVGAQSAFASPSVGTAVNAIWYNTNAAATTWVSNSTWAINDGAPTNFFGMTLEAEALSDVHQFHRGDPNNSGSIDISDAIAIFGYLFLGDAVPTCMESADVNNDGNVDISDGVNLLSWLFVSGPEPATPGPTTSPCGLDPDPTRSSGDLGCEDYGHCS